MEQDERNGVGILGLFMDEMNILSSNLNRKVIVSVCLGQLVNLFMLLYPYVLICSCSFVQLKLVNHSFCRLLSVESGIPVVWLIFRFAFAAGSSAAGRTVL